MMCIHQLQAMLAWVWCDMWFIAYVRAWPHQVVLGLEAPGRVALCLGPRPGSGTGPRTIRIWAGVVSSFHPRLRFCTSAGAEILYVRVWLNSSLGVVVQPGWFIFILGL